MRLLADENFPGPVVRRLRADGHDLIWIKELTPGVCDADVLARAQSEKRVLVTFDKDFGELAFRAGLSADCGVILLRLSGSSPQVDNDRAVEALAGREDWSGHFSVIQDDRIRMRHVAKASGSDT